MDRNNIAKDERMRNANIEKTWPPREVSLGHAPVLAEIVTRTRSNSASANQ